MIADQNVRSDCVRDKSMIIHCEKATSFRYRNYGCGRKFTDGMYTYFPLATILQVYTVFI